MTCWIIHYVERERKTLSAVYWFMHFIRSISMQQMTDWYHPFFKASRVSPEAVAWGQRLVRPTMATCQQYRCQAKINYLPGLLEKHTSLEWRNLEEFIGCMLTHISMRSLIEDNKCATDTVHSCVQYSVRRIVHFTCCVCGFNPNGGNHAIFFM